MPALIGLSYLSLLALSLLDNIRGPFYPEILHELHLDGTVGSAFFAVTNLFAFLGSVSTHRVAERHSSLFLLNVSAFFVGIGYAGIALSPNLTLMLCACAFFGYAYGALNLAQNVMIVEEAPNRMRRRMLNGLHSMYGLAALLAPVTASLIRWAGFTWRQGFLGLALIPVLVSLGGTRFKTKRKSKPVPTAKPGTWKRWLLFSVMMAGYLWGEISASTRLVIWLRTEHGFSPDGANLYLGLFFGLLLTGRIFFSLVHLPVNNWWILFVSASSAAACYLLALTVSPLWIAAAGLCMSPFFPVAMEQVSNLFAAHSNQALGFVIGFGSLSVVAMHVVVGYLSDRFGIGHALFLGPATLAAVSLGLAMVLWRSRQTVGLKPH